MLGCRQNDVLGLEPKSKSLEHHYLKMFRTKKSFDQLLAKNKFNIQSTWVLGCPTLAVWLLTGVRRTRYKGRLAIVLLTIHPIGALFNCSTKHTVMDLYLSTIIININNIPPSLECPINEVEILVSHVYRQFSIKLSLENL